MRHIPVEASPEAEQNTTLETFAVQAITPRLKRMLSHLEGVREGATWEPVHQMRVWSRRTRAALDIFRPCFPGKSFLALEREVKTVTRALGEARDLDVMIQTLQKRAETLPPDQRGGVLSFIGRLEAHRLASQKPVVQAVTRLERLKADEWFQEIVMQKSKPLKKRRKTTGKVE